MTFQTNKRPHNLKTGVWQGVKKGWKGFFWLLKLIVPISFATTLLVHFGIIYKLDFLLTPLMNWLCLPASAALVLIIGMFTGIYGTVAALSVMPFSMDHMILIALFTLIAHNLVQESLVQGKSGINPVFAGLFRVFMALGVTFVCAKIMGVTSDRIGTAALDMMTGPTKSFAAMFKVWSLGTVKLGIQIFCIIMPLMVVMELAKQFDIINGITRLISPVLTVMGLNRSTGMLWLTASIFGLAYGAAVIVEETQAHEFEKQELTRLHLSIGVNHAMIEDPALFLPLGLPIFWLWVPRLIAAMIAAWLYWGVCSARRRYAERVVHKKLCDH